MIDFDVPGGLFFDVVFTVYNPCPVSRPERVYLEAEIDPATQAPTGEIIFSSSRFRVVFLALIAPTTSHVSIRELCSPHTPLRPKSSYRLLELHDRLRQLSCSRTGS